MNLFVVCEMGTLGKKALRAYFERDLANRFIRTKSTHLFKLEECSAPDGYAPPAELFAAHVFDTDYNIHRFAGLCISNEEATRLAGAEGLVVMLVPDVRGGIRHSGDEDRAE